MLNIGFSLTEALGFIADTDKQLTSGVIEIQQKLTDGYSFSESIKSMVDAQSYHQLLIAERHGQLREVLAELATFDRLKLKQFKKNSRDPGLPAVFMLNFADSDHNDSRVCFPTN